VRTFFRWSSCAVLASVLAVSGNISGAYARPPETGLCPQGVTEPHYLPPYSFESSSRVDPQSLFQYKHAIVACVSNENDKILKVKWPLASLKSYVPARTHLEGPPLGLSTEETSQISTCLFYGDVGDSTSALLLVEKGREAELMYKDVPCDDLKRSASNTIIDPNDSFFQPITVFFPDDAKNPAETMLRLDASMRLAYKDKGVYVSSVSYEILPFRDSMGRPERVTLRASYPSQYRETFSLFADKYATVKGFAKGGVEFPIYGVSKGRFGYIGLDVLDISGTEVATVPIPVIFPEDAR
jgi:hypothetical protein